MKRAGAIVIAMLLLAGCGGAKPVLEARPDTTRTAFADHRFNSIASPVIGEVFHATTGKWRHAPSSYAYQWERCPSCAAISGAEAKTSAYTVQTADEGHKLRVAVTATNSFGSTTAYSTETGEVPSSETREYHFGNTISHEEYLNETPALVSGSHAAVSEVTTSEVAGYFREGCQIYAWGNNQKGELGNGNETNSATPVEVKKPEAGTCWTALAHNMGKENAIAIESKGHAYAWGSSSSYTGCIAGTQNVPTKIEVTPSIIEATGAGNHQTLLTAEHKLIVCGGNSKAESGAPEGESGAPKELATAAGGANICQVTGGEQTIAVLTCAGVVWAAGDNKGGRVCINQASHGSGEEALNLVFGLKEIKESVFGEKVKQIYYGQSESFNGVSMFLTEAGIVYGCGQNTHGELGTGNTTEEITPTISTKLNELASVSPKSAVTKVVAGGQNTIVLLANDEIYGVGNNAKCSLGIGKGCATTSETTPVKIDTGVLNLDAQASNVVELK
jgi:alpha-tubulin suppressor-like RCC1 family protein